MRKKLVALLFMILGIFTFGKDYPSKNINLIVPFAAGGGTDAVARKLGSLLERELGQPVIIVNRTGGAGAVGMTAGSTSKKDGYTITMITREIVSLPLMKLSPITYKNFDLVSLVNMDPAVVLVGKDSKYKTFQDILDDAKARPEKVKFASTAKPNFYALAIENKVGVKFNHIPYNGAGEVVPALLGNHADFTLMGPGEAIGQIKSGQFRALGLMATERSATLPEIPTLGELGYDIVSGTWRGIAVPKGTDPEIIDTLNKAIEKVTKTEDFNNFMNNANFGVKYLGPKDFEKFIEDDTTVIKEIIDNLN
ncbi:MAG: tripartite tricarboxylate transporter substrate binding protein [Fusobacterium perfoetens]|uniref:tripartite tricarboxylate transporter substrate binding protein n=1 Tax=Fusobacterium perfoetens TaxID=852 RepID=UPI0023F01EC5|nr:tripartite tricarboxylate transporter substrate binding protein [Fusobacterium perfoetens]MCI6151762.1 tripartite tricarboxylate transporter substrate binding protein [Fusobacterium perfoetens]MDY3236877.1 tripartite tricarboxylate transporter substrate binding protein [Fusobacterium perfoetens]